MTFERLTIYHVELRASKTILLEIVNVVTATVVGGFAWQDFRHTGSLHGSHELTKKKTTQTHS